jgi:hypothetical protein
VIDKATSEQWVPMRRLRPSSHLQRAAKESLASPEEHYYLEAAKAEALAQIADVLQLIEQHLAKLAER